MRFLCDVHISYKVKKILVAAGHHAVQVNELPAKSETKDKAICIYADSEDGIVITKDSDFLDFCFIKKSPKKIIKINPGNIATSELIQLLFDVLSLAQNVLQRERFLIEIDKDGSYTVDPIN